MRTRQVVGSHLPNIIIWYCNWKDFTQLNSPIVVW